MKFRLSKNYQDILFDAEIGPDEVKGMNSAELAELIKSAYTAAEEVFESHSQFKTIILDTFSVEEQRSMEESKKQIDQSKNDKENNERIIDAYRKDKHIKEEKIKENQNKIDKLEKEIEEKNKIINVNKKEIDELKKEIKNNKILEEKIIRKKVQIKKCKSEIQQAKKISLQFNYFLSVLKF